MNLATALSELVIFVREFGDAEAVHVEKAARIVEQRAQRLQRTARRREVARGSTDCELCGHRSRSGLLCWACLADAPEQIRTAFKMASGLDEMRAATRAVREYARGIRRKEAA